MNNNPLCLSLAQYNQKTELNWGDAIAPYIVKEISGEFPKCVNMFSDTNEFRYYCVGSVIQNIRQPNCEIWGAGFINKYDIIRTSPPIKIHAVRGPLTRELLIKQKFECPEVYGDPALLISKYYKPDIKKKYKLGIIPHYVDINSIWLNNFINVPNVKIINVLNTEEEMNNHRFINDVLSCDYIASSSLHGLIIADAYNIPSAWIELSNKLNGEGFKFRDYFMSVGRTDMLPLIVNVTTTINDVFNKFSDYKLKIDLDLLLDVCPFKK